MLLHVWEMQKSRNGKSGGHLNWYKSWLSCYQLSLILASVEDCFSLIKECCTCYTIPLCAQYSHGVMGRINYNNIQASKHVTYESWNFTVLVNILCRLLNTAQCLRFISNFSIQECYVKSFKYSTKFSSKCGDQLLQMHLGFLC